MYLVSSAIDQQAVGGFYETYYHYSLTLPETVDVHNHIHITIARNTLDKIYYPWMGAATSIQYTQRTY